MEPDQERRVAIDVVYGYPPCRGIRIHGRYCLMPECDHQFGHGFSAVHWMERSTGFASPVCRVDNVFFQVLLKLRKITGPDRIHEPRDDRALARPIGLEPRSPFRDMALRAMNELPYG